MLQIYWAIGENGKIPSVWPDTFNTKINLKNPINFTYMNNKYKVFVAVSVIFL